MSATGVVWPRAVRSASTRAAAQRMAGLGVGYLGGRRGDASGVERLPPDHAPDGKSASGAVPRRLALTGAVVHRVAGDAYVR